MHPPLLNLGCGLSKRPGWLNVDLYGDPDMVMDIDKTPWPFEDESFHRIYASHVFEHLDNWWDAFVECSRVLKAGGELEIRVPDESASMALAYRDHRRVFTKDSFHGIRFYGTGNNAWAKGTMDSVPLVLRRPVYKVPFPEYVWLERWFPRVFCFLANHARNFVHEQIFIFVKISGRE